VKIITAGRLSQQEGAFQLRTEAQSLARLHHPHIADVYDFGTGDVPYIVMEFVDGVPLSHALAGGAKLAWVEAASVAAQIAAALAAAHRRGIVHRDVASGNVLLTADGVKLIDFGISASEGNLDADRGEMLMGTPAYLAPERIEGQPVQPESDVYAVGVVLYRMLSGHFPFEAENAKQLIRAHREQLPLPLPPVAGMPVIVADLCRACLAKDSADRPTAEYVSRSLFDLLGAMVSIPMPARTADDEFLSTHLLPWSDQARPAAAPAVGKWRRGRAKTTVAAAGVLLAVAAGWAVNGWNSPTASSTPINTQSAQRSAAPIQCKVTYQSIRDEGGSFTATITVANVGDSAIADPRLTFDLPGDQQLAPDRMWQQDGRTVTTVPGLLALPVDNGVRIPLAGTYSGAHAYPLTFLLNGRPCAAAILGPNGVPLIATPSSQPSHRPLIIVDATPPAGVPMPPSGPSEIGSAHV